MKSTAITIIATLLSAAIYGYAAQPHNNLPTIPYGETPDLVNLIEQDTTLQSILFNIYDDRISDPILCGISLVYQINDKNNFNQYGKAIFINQVKPKIAEHVRIANGHIIGSFSKKSDSIFSVYCNDMTQQIISWADAFDKNFITKFGSYYPQYNWYHIAFFFSIVPTPKTSTISRPACTTQLQRLTNIPNR